MGLLSIFSGSVLCLDVLLFCSPREAGALLCNHTIFKNALRTTSFWTVWRIYLKLNEEGLDFRWTFKANRVVCFKETRPELHRESMETVYLHSMRVLGQHSDRAALTCLVVQLLPWQLCVCRLHFPANTIRQHLPSEHGSLWLVEQEAECSGNTQVDNHLWGRAKLWMLPPAWGGGGARQFRHSARESAFLLHSPLSRLLCGSNSS